MDFGTIYTSTATASKQLEARWFFDDNDGQALKKEVHMMPFQRRNLSYWRGVNYGVGRSRKKRKTLQKTDSSKTTDLLYSIWKHRVRNYNDAFLSSPRRTTRGFSKTNAESDLDEESGKRKSDAEASPSRKRPRTSEDETNGDSKEMEVSPSKDSESGNKNGGNEANEDITSESKTLESKETTHLISETEDTPLLPEKENGSRRASLQQSVPDYLFEIGAKELRPVLEFRVQSQAQRQPINGNADLNGNGGDTAAMNNSDLAMTGVINPTTKVIFHFLYIDSTEVGQSPLCLQTDATPENYAGHRRCPFCYFDGGSDSGLLMHCLTCHGQTHNFKAARSEDGTLHVAVTKNPNDTWHNWNYDFVYVRSRQKQSSPGFATVPFVKRQKSNMDVATRRKKLRLISELGCTDPNVLEQYVPDSDVPIRQYFHSRSNEPMLEGEWDIDSDDETDDNWLHKMGEALMEEFDDVTPTEKRFANLWNRFMHNHIVVPDNVVPSKCTEFLRLNIQHLLDLRQEVLLHFSGLWDMGLISADHFHELMMEFDKLKDGMKVQGGERDDAQDEVQRVPHGDGKEDGNTVEEGLKMPAEPHEDVRVSEGAS